MYSRSSFGSYYPIDSIIHRLNPVVKIVNFVLMLIVLIVSKSLYTNLFLLGLIFVMSLLSYVPFRYYFNTFWFLRYIYILIAFICAYFDQSLQTCMIYIIKLVVLVEYINIIAYTTSPSESAYGIEKFLSLFNFIQPKPNKPKLNNNNNTLFIKSLIVLNTENINVPKPINISIEAIIPITFFPMLSSNVPTFFVLLFFSSKDVILFVSFNGVKLLFNGVKPLLLGIPKLF